MGTVRENVKLRTGAFRDDYSRRWLPCCVEPSSLANFSAKRSTKFFSATLTSDSSSIVRNLAIDRRGIDACLLSPGGDETMSKTDTEAGTASLSSGSGDGNVSRAQSLTRKLMRYGRRAMRHAKTSADLTDSSMYEATVSRTFSGLVDLRRFYVGMLGH